MAGTTVARLLRPVCASIPLLAALAAGCAGSGLGTPPPQARPSLRAVRLPSVTGELDGMRVVNVHTGAVFRVYHDSVSARAAREALPRLDSVYTMLARATGADPGEIDWAAVAFVADTAYVSPRHRREIRWTVRVLPDGTLGGRGERDLYVTVPHEQVHSIQATYRPHLPRWLEEGMATWAGLQATRAVRPALEAEERGSMARARQSAPDTVRLARWGGVQVRREAILRQVSPEQRARMEREPSYFPPGPFSLTPQDMVADESMQPARYAAAHALFEEFDRTAGRERMRAWMAALWRGQGRVTAQEAAESAKAALGLDVEPRLR